MVPSSAVRLELIPDALAFFREDGEPLAFVPTVHAQCLRLTIWGGKTREDWQRGTIWRGSVHLDCPLSMFATLVKAGLADLGSQQAHIFRSRPLFRHGFSSRAWQESMAWEHGCVL